MIERSGIQGLIVRSYQQFGFLHSAHLMFTVEDAGAGREALAAIVPRVCHAAADMAAADCVLNVSLSWAGLNAIGAVGPAACGEFPAEFMAGPDAVITGDREEDAPAGWWEGQFGSPDVHLVVHAFARGDDALRQGIASIRAALPRAGVRELIPTRANGPLLAASLSPNPQELHFGYLDGFSQPDVDWEDRKDRPEALDPRHFLLGYGNEAFPSSPPADGAAAALVRDGSYLVLRWIYQDVAAFEQFLTAHAPAVAQPGGADPRELLAAKMMGRWRDGTPLVLSPDAPDPTIRADPFDYRQDQDGRRCPFAAHVRIANHRDDELSHADEGMFGPWKPRMIRRGMSYGPKLEGRVDDRVDRGIVGLFFCASINLQFYPLMRWMRKTSFQRVFEKTSNHRQDPIVGNRNEDMVDRSFTIPMPGGDIVLEDMPRFLRTKGTLFLLTPGLGALGRMAGIADA